MSMDRKLLLNAALAVGLLALLAAPAGARQKSAPAPSAARNGGICGKVLNGKDGVPYANVSVVGNPKLGALTDETGSYVLHLVPIGTVTLKAQALGFEAQTQTVVLTAGASATVNFA